MQIKNTNQTQMETIYCLRLCPFVFQCSCACDNGVVVLLCYECFIIKP